jgi:hypothetical protein
LPWIIDPIAFRVEQRPQRKADRQPPVIPVPIGRIIAPDAIMVGIAGTVRLPVITPVIAPVAITVMLLHGDPDGGQTKQRCGVRL